MFKCISCEKKFDTLQAMPGVVLSGQAGYGSRFDLTAPFYTVVYDDCLSKGIRQGAVFIKETTQLPIVEMVTVSELKPQVDW